MRRKGFTLVELMVVVLIVGILAAVVIPIMRGKIDSAKWSEGKAMAGTISTAIRSYAAGEEANAATTLDLNASFGDLGLLAADFNGKYFESGDFAWAGSYDGTTPVYTITITNSDLSPTAHTLQGDGTWD